MTREYRPDIDGLRAIAVLSILLFHAGVDGFDGGYVGVDVFFVISGFLITSIIVRELAGGGFSIAGFYERRVRRILPALVAAVVATLAAGLVFLTPAQLEDLGASALATSVFASNHYFLAGAGYFDGPSEAKPLLHSWSLAVEEQFYIVYPLLLAFLWRRLPGRVAVAVATLALLSFVASLVVLPRWPDAAFYLFPLRAWELLIGALLALGIFPAPGPRLRLVAAGAGILTILASVHLLTPETSFPGWAALGPTLGTALVIGSGTGAVTPVHRWLSVRALVYLGLISYSLYLWHWPVVVYAKQFLINEPTGWQVTAIIATSILLASLSWRFVEQPFRDRSRFKGRKRLFATAAAVVLVASLPAAAFVVSDGLPGRSTAADLGEVVAADPGWQHWKRCEELAEENRERPELCRLGAAERTPTVLLWGDSHALSLASAVNLAAIARDKAGLMAVRTGCPPLIGIDRPGRTSCAEFNAAILDRLAAETGIGTVILAARWTLSAEGSRYKQEEGAAVELRDVGAGSGEKGSAGGTDTNGNLFALGIERTIAEVAALGRRIVLVGQVPEVGYDVPAAAFAARLRGTDVTAAIGPTLAEYRDRTARVRPVLEAIAARTGVTYLQPATRLCDEERCRVVIDDVPLYRDDNHLSLRGNVFVSDLFDTAFE